MLVLVGLLIAWSFDLLFWEQPFGISYLIIVLLLLSGGVLLTWQQGGWQALLRTPPASLVLVLLALACAGMTFLRKEPMSDFLGVALSLSGLALLSITWLGGGWWKYSVGDYFLNGLHWFFSLVTGPFGLAEQLRAGKDATDGEAGAAAAPGKNSGRAGFFALLRGLLLALPVVFLLGSLLAAADPIFAREMEGLLSFVSFDRLAETLFRIGIILAGAYILVGVFLYAILKSPDEKIRQDDKPLAPAFLGWVEASTLLGCVVLLFGFFVIIQFRYFFGGQSNINLSGFTYAEYARRGFGELVAVAFLSLLLFLVLSVLTRRTELRSQRLFSFLGVTLVALVGVILVSAFQRLQLYEAVYGFTRLRTYTHVFIIWLGLLLAATVALEVARRLRFFPLAAVLFAFGFGLSLGLLNVDGWIVQQNVDHAARGGALDTNTLVRLSTDAVPALFKSYTNESLPQTVRQDLGIVLACQSELMELPQPGDPWQGFHLSSYRAAQWFSAYAPLLEAQYPLAEDEYGGLTVQVDGVWEPCYDPLHID
jgi:hypothetical protein